MTLAQIHYLAVVVLNIVWGVLIGEMLVDHSWYLTRTAASHERS